VALLYHISAGEHLRLYVYDLWVHQWWQRCTTGEMIVVRQADDIIVSFEHRQ
jgi:hypothetical protein